MLYIVIFPQLRERTAVYLLKILAHPGLSQEQMTTCGKFKALMLSLNLQSMRLNAGDNKITNDEEVSAINRFYYLISGFFIKVTMHLQGCLACKRSSAPGLNCRYLNPYIK